MKGSVFWDVTACNMHHPAAPDYKAACLTLAYFSAYSSILQDEAVFPPET
jgi:hypothetical protein